MTIDARAELNAKLSRKRLLVKILRVNSRALAFEHPKEIRRNILETKYVYA